MTYKRYSKYKDSGVKWIGKIPKEWNTIRLKMLTRIRRGASPRPIDDSKYFDENGEYSWVRISDVTKSNMYLNESEQKLSNEGVEASVKIEPGELFISICATVGKPCISNIKCCIHDGFVYFPDFKGDYRYLYYIFEAGEAYRGLGKLGTQLNLNTDSISGICIPNIDFMLQKKIADFLDKEIPKIDCLIYEKERLIELLKEKRKAIITEAVTKGLDKNIEMKDSGIEWMSKIPKEWNIVRLKMLTRVKRGASPRPIDDPKYFDENGEYSWVRISDVTRSNMYLEKSEQRLSSEGIKASVKIEPGELFISICATVGKPCISNIKCCIHDGFVYFPDFKGDCRYLYYVFESGEAYKGLGKLGTQLNLNTDSIGGIYIPDIDFIIQSRIADFLDEKISKIYEVIKEEEKLIELLKEYKKSLISEVVTGKIDVRNEA